MKIADIRHNLIKIHRRHSLRKDTPQILKTLYIDRSGSLADLKKQYGNDEIQKHLYLGNIQKLSGDTWQTTKRGAEDIKIFHSKQTPFQTFKSIIFGILSRPFE